MSEALFRVGGVYRDNRGWLMRLVEPSDEQAAKRFAAKWGDRGVEVFRVSERTGESVTCNDGWRLLSTGRYHEHRNSPESQYSLIPGELTFVDGAWVTPTLDKLEAEKDSEWDAEDNHRANDRAWAEWGKVVAEITAADLAMIARDSEGFARAMPTPPAPVVLQEPASTAHPAIPGLTRMSAQDHRLGLGRTF